MEGYTLEKHTMEYDLVPLCVQWASTLGVPRRCYITQVVCKLFNIPDYPTKTSGDFP